MCSYVCTQHFTRKKSFCKNVTFSSVALIFQYGGCFNASLSRYAMQIYFVLKVNSEKITGPSTVKLPIQSVMQSCSCLNQELS